VRTIDPKEAKTRKSSDNLLKRLASGVKNANRLKKNHSEGHCITLVETEDRRGKIRSESKEVEAQTGLTKRKRSSTHRMLPAEPQSKNEPLGTETRVMLKGLRCRGSCCL